MNVLLIGGGGREHALAWSLSASPLLERLYAAPGNAGISEVAECVPLDVSDHAAVIAFSRDHAIDLVVVGPEAPLVAGLVDDLTAAGIRAFGPTRAAARLEGSKGFTKDLARANAIPTADYGRFDSLNGAREFLDARPDGPVVVKADGLAAGKGVTVCTSRTEAQSAVDALFTSDPDAEVVIEEFLDGEEASFFALVDGTTVLPLATAQDHKRAHDGDTGPNTGGMGAYSPAPVMTDAMIDATLQRIVVPTVEAMAAAGTPFSGVLYAGLMITDDGPQLIEYNVRFGDPEAQVLMVRLKSDLLSALMATVDRQLHAFDLRWHDDAALCVVMAAEGYPGPYEKGSAIGGLDEAAAEDGVEVFHAGTKLEDGVLVAAGGRVLGVTALGRDLLEARNRAYHAVGEIDWPQGYCRSDIGWRALGR